MDVDHVTAGTGTNGRRIDEGNHREDAVSSGDEPYCGTCNEAESSRNSNTSEDGPKNCLACNEAKAFRISTTEVKDSSKKDLFEHLPDHLIMEVLIRVPVSCWASAACVRKKWAALLGSEMLWQMALENRWPGTGRIRRWPGPIGRSSHKRRYIALHTSMSHFCFEDPDMYELVGHAYLYLKEQLEVSSPQSYGLLHGTIVDQFLACGKQGNTAHELASKIWVAVINNLDDSEKTFNLLMRIVEEWEVYLPYPYTKSHAVQWKLFERLVTDFRDCLGQLDYYRILSTAKHKFDYIPPAWLGF